MSITHPIAHFWEIATRTFLYALLKRDYTPVNFDHPVLVTLEDGQTEVISWGELTGEYKAVQSAFVDDYQSSAWNFKSTVLVVLRCDDFSIIFSVSGWRFATKLCLHLSVRGRITPSSSSTCVAIVFLVSAYPRIVAVSHHRCNIAAHFWEASIFWPLP